MLAWASPEDFYQERIDLIAYPRHRAFAWAGDVESPDFSSAQPVLDRGSSFLVSGIENEQGPSEAGCTPFCPIGSQVLVRLGSRRPQDQGRVGVADVPFRPLRTWNVGRMGAPVLRGFLMGKACRDDHGVAFTRERTPSTTANTAPFGGPERRVRDSILPSGARPPPPAG